MLRKIAIYIFLVVVFVTILNWVIASIPKRHYMLYPGQQQIIVEGYLVLPVVTNAHTPILPLTVTAGRVIIYKYPYPTM
ncbi:MAG: hypothetical protein D6711_03090 [Chloroflexi bacterium]|nr:MAG: hypothetical protein D6711_03090 [Chloroflexota bacterium]